MAEFISVSTIKDTLTECPICTEQFDEDSRVPRRMPCCVQSICQPCLETYSRGRPTMSCPLCRHQHHLPGGIKSLPKEPLILKILDHLKIQKGIRLPCTGCPDKKGAVAQCDTCGVFLCTWCVRAHERNIVTKNHKIVTFDEMKDRPVESFMRQHQCMEHDHPLQFFCKTCNKVICVSCTVVDHKEGKGHYVISLDEAHQVKAESVDEILTQLEEKANNLRSKTEKLKERKDNIEVSRQRAKDDINEAFDILVEQLNKRRTDLLFDVDWKSDKNLRVATKALEATTVLLTKVESATDYTRQMRSKADKIQDLQLMVSSRDSLNTMLEETAQDAKFDRTGVTYTPANIHHLTTVISKSGLVRTVTFSPTDFSAYEMITIEPAEVAQVTVTDVTIPIGGREITCPRLEWDTNTASQYVTISGSVITNTTSNPFPPDTGCRMQKGWVLASRPLVIKRGQRVIYLVKNSFTIRDTSWGFCKLLELALTSYPEDTYIGQHKGLGVQVISCFTHKEQIRLQLRYDDRLLTDFPIAKYEKGVSRDLNLCFLLDWGTNKIHVVDVDDVRVVSTVTDVVFERPPWVILFQDICLRSDVRTELITSEQVNLTWGLTKLLSSCC